MHTGSQANLDASSEKLLKMTCHVVIRLWHKLLGRHFLWVAQRAHASRQCMRALHRCSQHELKGPEQGEMHVQVRGSDDVRVSVWHAP